MKLKCGFEAMEGSEMCKIKETGGRKFKLLQTGKNIAYYSPASVMPEQAVLESTNEHHDTFQNLQYEQNKYKAHRDDLIIPSMFKAQK